MNWIKYRYKGADASIGWNEENEALAEAEADKGKYTIEDDGLPESNSTSADELLEVMLGVTDDE